MQAACCTASTLQVRLHPADAQDAVVEKAPQSEVHHVLVTNVDYLERLQGVGRKELVIISGIGQPVLQSCCLADCLCTGFASHAHFL